MKIAVIPLDDRPCNFEYLRDLGEIGSLEICLPPKDLIRSLAPEFKHSALAAWLRGALSDAEAAVISIDGWIHGGLIRSRKMEVSPELAEKRLQALSEIQNEFPTVAFYFSHVLLRLSVTINAEQNESNWRDIFRYSVLKGKNSLSEPEARELASLEERIPSPLLSEYLAVRRRNHQLNLQALQLLPRAEFVLFGQEDCAPEGLHQAEKKALLEKLSKERSLILTGADEMGAQLVLLAYMKKYKVARGSLPLALELGNAHTLKQVSRYEDIAAYENLRLHFQLSPFTLIASSDKRRNPLSPTLFVRGFSSEGQPDLCFADTSPTTHDDFSGFVARIQDGDALLDLSFANGADFRLMQTILKEKNISLSGFSAWNTTGNRLGTLIAQLGIREIAKRQNQHRETADRKYTLRSLLDDFLYQSHVRQGLLLLAQDMGVNPWALGSSHEEFNEFCESHLKEAAADFGLPDEFSASLPWPRLFEVLIRL